jgi:hypothetical protein
MYRFALGLSGIRHPTPTVLGVRDTGEIDGKLVSVGERIDIRRVMGIPRLGATFRAAGGVVGEASRLRL